ncbi:MAG TPA: lytic transglycosylase domain-containing protein [bacterium]|nr:lytic transglycosylase domain-containing protein [bacterium]
MLTSGRGPQHRGQTVLLALLGVLLMAFAAAADVYYTYQNGVYVLSNIQRTEQFKPAVATEEAEDQNADDATVAFKPTTFESLLVKYCGRYQVDINLVKAVMMAESNMRHTNNDGVVITSAKGAVGIMQVMPATGAAMGLSNLSDLETNIHAGVKYLSQMLRRFDGNTVKAVAAYNAGPGAVAEHNGIPPYPETRNYVQVVLKHYHSGNFSGAEPETGNNGPVVRPVRQLTDRRGNVVLTNIY